MYCYNALGAGQVTGQVTGQNPKPPEALVTVKAAPISAQALTWNASGNPLQEDRGPETTGGAGIINEDVQKLRGFCSATPIKHRSSNACSPGAEGRSFIFPPFRVFLSQEEQLKSKEIDSTKPDGNNTRNYSGFLH